MESQSQSILRLFQERKIIDRGQLARINKASPTEILKEILARELLSREDLIRILEDHFFAPYTELEEIEFDPSILRRVPRLLAVRFCILPFALDKTGNEIQIAMANPLNVEAIDQIGRASRLTPRPWVAFESELIPKIQEFYSRLETIMKPDSPSSRNASAESPSNSDSSRASRLAISYESLSRPHADTQDSLIPSLVEEIFDRAVRLKASDIHFEPKREALQVRYRLDGVLQKGPDLPGDLSAAVVSRLKILSEMDISEKRKPQDGRAVFSLQDSRIDLRLSSLPAIHGEKIVVRILKKDHSLIHLDRLCMPESLLKRYREIIQQPLGMVLVTGPTGSGKTTTLYATLSELNSAEENIVTLENPIEYEMPQITQVQIHPKAGLTFASGLSSILRQDPDIILVGEIRDVETVEVACRAALTGHKVFSTLHTNDAPKAITRLIDMGIPPFLIAASLSGILAQRLVRKICPSCREEYSPGPDDQKILGQMGLKSLYRGTGCPACAGTGYTGRIALFELLTVNEMIHKLIIDRATDYTIRYSAERNGMVSMIQSGKQAVLSGLTTLDELKRVVLAEDSHESICPGCQRVVSVDFAICPFCQKVLKESCHACGASIEADWDACPNCGVPIEREWKKNICSNCLAILEPGWTHCPYCGR